MIQEKDNQNLDKNKIKFKNKSKINQNLDHFKTMTIHNYLIKIRNKFKNIINKSSVPFITMIRDTKIIDNNYIKLSNKMKKKILRNLNQIKVKISKNCKIQNPK